jgi:hypothetical protein
MSVAKVVNVPHKYWAHRLSSSPRPLPRRFGEPFVNSVALRLRGCGQRCGDSRSIGGKTTSHPSRFGRSGCFSAPRPHGARASSTPSAARCLERAWRRPFGFWVNCGVSRYPPRPIASAVTLAAKIPGPVVSGTFKGAIGFSEGPLVDPTRPAESVWCAYAAPESPRPTPTVATSRERARAQLRRIDRAPTRCTGSLQRLLHVVFA